MALMNELPLDVASYDRTLRTEGRESALRGFVKRVVWELYRSTQNQVILQKKILFFSVTIRVRDIRPLLVMWVGEE